MTRLVLATANPHKVGEIAKLLPGVRLVPRPEEIPDVVEDAGTLVGNARLKAVAICEATGAPAVADDTGLEVDALDGEPGVESAYYAGPEADALHNVAKLLNALDGVAERTARFRTVALVRFPDGSEIVAQGVVEGTIAAQRSGEAGFGYDPVFVPDDGDGRSFAEMSEIEKSAISHRGRAFRSLAELL
ncbi:MAG: RdgB/HAM1 family non-canonical purine NTP pyrophosphatase [Actinomycetia bacterium]|nr:RdgB/HAM1 family non-canonical purine NTP pyrophosphatase [Actinomycetes bacterium]MCP4958428.1 RdgB/HAM1 family non-canonical purine NTP pyrophosphatase [Actinomycetes bacterium]